MKRKFTAGTLILLAIMSVAFYLQKEISYQEAALADAPQEIRNQLSNLPISGNTSTGIAQIGLKTYGVIIGQTGQQIEMISVGKAEDVGIDILYRVTESVDPGSEPPVKIVSFLNLFGGPVGFKKVE